MTPDQIKALRKLHHAATAYFDSPLPVPADFDLEYVEQAARAAGVDGELCRHLIRMTYLRWTKSKAVAHA